MSVTKATGTGAMERIERLLASGLTDALGGRFTIMSGVRLTRTTKSRLGLEAVPDVLIYDRQAARFVLVEVKGSQGTDLPLATLPIIRRLKKTYSSLESDLILVSLSRVPTTLRSLLEGEGLWVVEYRDDSTLIDKVADIVREAVADGGLTANYPEVWRNKGLTLAALGHHQEAIEAYDRALQLRPEAPEVWLDRGSALADLGKYGEAVADYDRALELRPSYSEAWLRKSVALRRVSTEAQR